MHKRLGPGALLGFLVVAMPGHAAGGAHSPSPEGPAPERALTPEQIFESRFPQKVRVGDLVGLPVQDYRDRVIGRIRQVVRTPEGKIRLIVPHGGFLGFGERPVAVPIETVAILARHVNALEFTLADFAAAPTWAPGTDQPIAPDDSIRIALSRR